MKKVTLILFLFILSNKVSAQSSEDKLIEKVMNSVINLKEVKERDAYVKKQTKGKRHLQYLIESEPSKESPYYTIRVAEDNGMSLYPHFVFYVYPKTMLIKVSDQVSGKTLDLKTWRSQNLRKK